jgi:hypothetical protein
VLIKGHAVPLGRTANSQLPARLAPRHPEKAKTALPEVGDARCSHRASEPLLARRPVEPARLPCVLVGRPARTVKLAAAAASGNEWSSEVSEMLITELSRIFILLRKMRLA